MASALRNWGEIIRTQNLSPDKAMDPVSRWLLITRASVFPMTIISALIGGLLAWGTTTLTEDADTGGGAGWVSGPLAQTTGGSATTNIVHRAAYKITTSSVAQPYNPTLGTARQGSICLVAFKAAAAAPGPASSSRQRLAHRFLITR